MLIELDGHGPLYLQLYRAVKALILSGVLSEGQKLPPTRQLAKQLSVSRNVVMLGYDQLKAEGYVVGGFGSGTRVVELLPEDRVHGSIGREAKQTESFEPAPISEQAEIALGYWRERAKLNQDQHRSLRYDFRYGDIEVDTQSIKIWKQLSSRLFTKSVHQYADPQGDWLLRDKVAEHLNQLRGCHCSAGQIAIVNGSQQALDIIARLFIANSETVIVEEPGYQAARAVFQAAGAKIHSIAVDQDGMQTEKLPVRPGSARLAYVTPSHQFPTGAILSLARRLALLEWAAQSQAYIIEDDYDSEFRFEGRPISALQGLDYRGRTLYVGTFSKVLFPALRIGYVVLPPNLVEPFIALRWHADRHTNTHQQRVLAEFIAQGHYERHLRRMRKRYEGRRQRLITLLETHFGTALELQGTNAGLHLMVQFKDRILKTKEAEILKAASAAGLGIYPASPLYQTPPDRLGLLFGYGAIDESEIEPGILLLKQVIESFQQA
ncbi:MAG: PLP-dependent aminotransferase family protein [Sedimenticola sp.]|nr:PLP-dependent aminotransferase family protein [Sedimenticola sp.]